MHAQHGASTTGGPAGGRTLDLCWIHGCLTASDALRRSLGAFFMSAVQKSRAS